MLVVLNISEESYFSKGWLGEVLRGIETLGIDFDLPFLQGK